MSRALMLGFGFLAHSALGLAQDFQVQLGPVRETRAAEGATVALDLMLLGDRAREVRGAQVIVEKAMDEGGADLVTKATPLQGRFVAKENESGYVLAQAVLRAPARGVAKIAQVSGVIQFSVPEKGASTVITVNPTAQSGKPVVADALTNSLADVVVYLAPEYNKLLKKKDAAQGAAAATPNPALSKAPAAFRDLFGAPASSPNPITNQQIAVVLKDLQNVVTDVGVFGAKGEALKPVTNSFSIVVGKERTRIFGFARPISPEMRVKLTVVSARETVRVPFSFPNISLP